MPIWASFADHRAGTQARIGPDNGAGTDGRAFQMGMAADARAGLHRYAGREHREGLDLDIVLDRRVMGEEHRFRRGHGDAVFQQRGAFALLEHGFGLRQLGAAG